MSEEISNLLKNTADINKKLTGNWEPLQVSFAKDIDFGADYSLSFECESTADSSVQARFNYISTDGKHKSISGTPRSAVSAGENQVTLLIPAFSRPDDFAKAYLIIQAEAIADDGVQLTIIRPMLVEGTTPAAWAPAEGETLAWGGAQMSANLWSDSTASMQIRADGTYLAGKAGTAELNSKVTGLDSLTENQTVHMGASLRGADSGSCQPYVEYADTAGNKNWVGFPMWTPTADWQRFDGSCVVPSGMTITALGFNNSRTTGAIEIANPTFSYGTSGPILASDSHTPYATQDHVRSEYAAKSHKHAMADVTGLQAALDGIAEGVYPVGSLYLNATDATNPHDLLGFGTWAAFGQGRMLLSASDAHEAGATGGSETVALTAEQMPGHTHTATTSSAGAHTHTSWYVGTFSNNNVNYGNSHLDKKWNSVGNGGTTEQYGRATLTAPSAGEHHHTLTTDSAGGGKAHNNMPPYITVYMWVRTA